MCVAYRDVDVDHTMDVTAYVTDCFSDASGRVWVVGRDGADLVAIHVRGVPHEIFFAVDSDVTAEAVEDLRRRMSDHLTSTSGRARSCPRTDCQLCVPRAQIVVGTPAEEDEPESEDEDAFVPNKLNHQPCWRARPAGSCPRSSPCCSQ